MLSDRPLLDAIIAAPDQDAPRLVYADWLEENGGGERAELIRLQIEAENRGCLCSRKIIRFAGRVLNRVQILMQRRTTCRSCQLQLQIKDLINKLMTKGDEEFVIQKSSHYDLIISRGFIEAVECDWRWFADNADKMLAQNPVRQVRLTSWPSLQLCRLPFTYWFTGMPFDREKAGEVAIKMLRSGGQWPGTRWNYTLLFTFLLLRACWPTVKAWKFPASR